MSERFKSPSGSEIKVVERMTNCLRLPLILGVVSVYFASQVGSGSERPLKSRTFLLTYQATIRDVPRDAKTLLAWVPLPQTDANQTIHQISIMAPVPITIGRESRFGNQCLHARVDGPKGPVQITLVIEATRRENSGRHESLSALDRRNQLAPEPLVPLDGPIKELAVGATKGLTTDEDKARAIYDKVTGMMKYDKSGTGWGHGDTLWACDSKHGNCTDFHSVFISMTRAEKIPARFEIGFPLPADKHSAEIPGYHCWAEFYLNSTGWVPVDISEAWKHQEKHDYFFGAHDVNRMQFTQGRDLKLAPSQEGPPLNYFVYPYVEIGGKEYPNVSIAFSFEDAGSTATKVSALR